METARIAPVVTLPKSGVPDDSSKIEPTAAIAVMQEPNNNMPLFGVKGINPPNRIKTMNLSNLVIEKFYFVKSLQQNLINAFSSISRDSNERIGVLETICLNG